LFLFARLRLILPEYFFLEQKYQINHQLFGRPFDVGAVVVFSVQTTYGTAGSAASMEMDAGVFHESHVLVVGCTHVGELVD
jgi:hypothetical protein